MRYKITIREIESIYPEPVELTGEFQAETQDEAQADAKDFFAEALDTFEDNIEIISIIKI